MTFDELFKAVAKKSGCSFKQAKAIIESTRDVILEETLSYGRSVNYAKFGTFEKRHVKATCRPVGGTMLDVRAGARVVFRAAKRAKRSE